MVVGRLKPMQGGLTVVNLNGGMRAWSDAELPVVPDDGSPGTVI
jgi:rhodanese-related sulfurtransferase